MKNELNTKYYGIENHKETGWGWVVFSNETNYMVAGNITTKAKAIKIMNEMNKSRLENEINT